MAGRAKTKRIIGSLHRHYSPVSFKQIQGQDDAIERLTGDVTANDMSRVYLFSGPSGVGKTTAVRLLLKALRCTQRQKSGEPCNGCAQCLQKKVNDPLPILSASQDDLSPALRSLCEAARLSPSTWMVCEVNTDSKITSWTARRLLKEMDYIPENMVVVFCAVEGKLLPASIKIRARRIAFRLVPDDVLFDYAREIAEEANLSILEHELHEAVHRGAGSVRDTLAALTGISNTT